MRAYVPPEARRAEPVKALWVSMWVDAGGAPKRYTRTVGACGEVRVGLGRVRVGKRYTTNHESGVRTWSTARRVLGSI